jgi:hypothetical protein
LGVCSLPRRRVEGVFRKQRYRRWLWFGIGLLKSILGFNDGFWLGVLLSVLPCWIWSLLRCCSVLHWRFGFRGFFMVI